MANGQFGGGSGTQADPYIVEDAEDLVNMGSLIDTFVTPPYDPSNPSAWDPNMYIKIANNISMLQYINTHGWTSIIIKDNTNLTQTNIKINGNNKTIDFWNINISEEIFRFKFWGQYRYANIENLQIDNVYIDGITFYLQSMNNIFNGNVFFNKCKFNIKHNGAGIGDGSGTNRIKGKFNFNYCEFNLTVDNTGFDAINTYIIARYKYRGPTNEFYRCAINIETIITDKRHIDAGGNPNSYTIDITGDGKYTECLITGLVHVDIEWYIWYGNYSEIETVIANLDNSYVKLRVYERFLIYDSDYEEPVPVTPDPSKITDLASLQFRNNWKETSYDASQYELITYDDPENNGMKSYLVYYANSSANTKSYYDESTINEKIHVSADGNAEAKADLEMKQQTTFVNWDFVNIWGINQFINDGYPYLLWYEYPTPQLETKLLVQGRLGLIDIPFHMPTQNDKLVFSIGSELKAIHLVETNDPNALPIRISTPSGIKAIDGRSGSN